LVVEVPPSDIDGGLVARSIGTGASSLPPEEPETLERWCNERLDVVLTLLRSALGQDARCTDAQLPMWPPPADVLLEAEFLDSVRCCRPGELEAIVGPLAKKRKKRR